jgi:hypothetical protein
MTKTKIKLTTKENNEPLFVSLGRMRIILQGYSKSSAERTLALFEKIVRDFETILSLEHTAEEVLTDQINEAKEEQKGGLCV